MSGLQKYIMMLNCVLILEPNRFTHCFSWFPLLALTRAGNKAVGVMKAGQTFTIEPMINAGSFTCS